jgi:hypothetical protein
MNVTIDDETTLFRGLPPFFVTLENDLFSLSVQSQDNHPLDLNLHAQKTMVESRTCMRMVEVPYAL